jgi:hypothetical protein
MEKSKETEKRKLKKTSIFERTGKATEISFIVKVKLSSGKAYPF